MSVYTLGSDGTIHMSPTEDYETATDDIEIAKMGVGRPPSSAYGPETNSCNSDCEVTAKYNIGSLNELYELVLHHDKNICSECISTQTRAGLHEGIGRAFKDGEIS